MYLRHFAFTRRPFPALAGNTHRSITFWILLTVHPRAGGEHVPEIERERIHFGSSPRWGGTPLWDTPPCHHRRFIPAQAGNTIRSRPRTGSRTVHPRAGGEHDESARGRVRGYDGDWDILLDEADLLRAAQG